jgi:multicomponent Na+:H+ antiporter subunit G
VIGRILVLVGSMLTLIAAFGMVRLRDVFTRMHALSKASTLGVIVVLVGAAITVDHPNDVTSLVIAGVLQLLTGPVASNMVSRATYRAEGIPSEVDVIDQLGDDLG